MLKITFLKISFSNHKLEDLSSMILKKFHLDEFPTGLVDVAEWAGKVGEELWVPPLGQRGGPLLCRLHVQKNMNNKPQSC